MIHIVESVSMYAFVPLCISSPVICQWRLVRLTSLGLSIYEKDVEQTQVKSYDKIGLQYDFRIWNRQSGIS